MELLSPHKFGVFEGRVEEEDIVLGFEFKPHAFGDEDELALFLVLPSGKGDELVDPFFDEGLKPAHEDGFELEVELGNPDVKVGDFAGAELVDDFLNGLELFGEDFCLEGAGRQRLDGRGDDLVFIADESLHLVEIQNDLSQVLGVLLNVLVVLVPEGVEALVDAVHHCPLLFGHQLDHLLVDLGRHLVVGSNGFLEGDDEGVEVDEGLPRPEHARLLGLDRIEGTDLLDEVDVFGLEVDCDLVLVLLDELEQLLLVELVILQDHIGLLVPLLHDGLSV